jgi:hypothetical protein
MSDNVSAMKQNKLNNSSLPTKNTLILNKYGLSEDSKVTIISEPDKVINPVDKGFRCRPRLGAIAVVANNP